MNRPSPTSLGLLCALLLFALPLHAVADNKADNKADKHAAAREAERPQDTGFLNRKITVRGTTYKYMVYLPEEYDPHRKWPVILFLHGMGERGSDGEAETSAGLPAAIRYHPERWPFVVVMPQMPYDHHYWPDADMMALAMAALEAGEREFHGDTDRVYLTGISAGGFGSWELAKSYPGRWAAIVPVAGGIRWDWAPNGRMGDPRLAEGYVAAVGRTPVWMFHGADDHTVAPSESEEMYDALKEASGHERLWIYERTGHPVWERAYAEPELPRWLLAHALHEVPTEASYAERRVVPVHPAPVKVDLEVIEQYVGEYSAYGSVRFWVTREGDRLTLHQKSSLNVLLPESPTSFFFETGGPTRVVFEKDAAGRAMALSYRDDRHEEVFLKTR